MLHILEMIGKGIGITLLCILILVVVLLLSVLFLPVRYVISGEKKPEENLPVAEAKLSWLFHILSASAQFKETLRYRVRLFGIPVYDSAREPKKKKGPKKKTVKKQKATRKTVQTHKTVEEPRLVGKWENPREDAEASGLADDGKREPNPTENEGNVPPEPMKQDHAGQEMSDQQIAQERESRNPFRKLWRKIKEFWAFLKRLWQKIIVFPKNLADKIRHFRDRITYYKEFLQREDLKRVITLCKGLLQDLWKDIRPRVVRARIHAGFDDPSVTGQLLAIHGMLYPFIGRNVYIEPDWETPVLEGTLLIRGHITIFVLLRILWKLYFDKDLKSVRLAWKKEEV